MYAMHILPEVAVAYTRQPNGQMLNRWLSEKNKLCPCKLPISVLIRPVYITFKHIIKLNTQTKATRISTQFISASDAPSSRKK